MNVAHVGRRQRVLTGDPWQQMPSKCPTPSAQAPVFGSRQDDRQTCRQTSPGRDGSNCGRSEFFTHDANVANVARPAQLGTLPAMESTDIDRRKFLRAAMESILPERASPVRASANERITAGTRKR
jgi:hypothetical protein